MKKNIMEINTTSNMRIKFQLNGPTGCQSWLHSECSRNPLALPGHEDVDKALVGVKLGRDVVFDPLVDGLRRWVCLDLHHQLLLQLQQREEEAQALPLQDLQHAVLILVDFCRGRSGAI